MMEACRLVMLDIHSSLAQFDSAMMSMSKAGCPSARITT